MFNQIFQQYLKPWNELLQKHNEALNWHQSLINSSLHHCAELSKRQGVWSWHFILRKLIGHPNPIMYAINAAKIFWLKEASCIRKNNIYTLFTKNIHNHGSNNVSEKSLFYFFLFFRFFLFFLPVFCFFAGDSSESESEFWDCDETVMTDCCPDFDDELCGEFSAAERYGTTSVLFVPHLMTSKTLELINNYFIFWQNHQYFVLYFSIPALWFSLKK